MLSLIELSEVSAREFDQINRIWYKKDPRVMEPPGLMKIERTIAAENHETLIEKFLEDPIAHHISVRGRKKWMRCYRENITPHNISNLIHVANTDDVRPGLMEFHFGLENYCARIRVAHHSKEDVIVGYEIKVPQHLIGKCNAKYGLKRAGTYLGLWDPFEGERTTLYKKEKAVSTR